MKKISKIVRYLGFGSLIVVLLGLDIYYYYYHTFQDFLLNFLWNTVFILLIMVIYFGHNKLLQKRKIDWCLYKSVKNTASVIGIFGILELLSSIVILIEDGSVPIPLLGSSILSLWAYFVIILLFKNGLFVLRSFYLVLLTSFVKVHFFAPKIIKYDSWDNIIFVIISLTYIVLLIKGFISSFDSKYKELFPSIQASYLTISLVVLLGFLIIVSPFIEWNISLPFLENEVNLPELQYNK